MMEGTDEVKENIYDMLISRYEELKPQVGNSISQLYERLMLLINNFTFHDKIYILRGNKYKIYVGGVMTFVEKTASIRERIDFNSMFLEKIFGKLKTYEMELEQENHLWA